MNECYTHAVPSLHENVLYCGCIPGRVFALDIETGMELWIRRITAVNGYIDQEMDTPYVEYHDGMVLAAVGKSMDKINPQFGNTRIVGLDSANGSTVWMYDSDMVLWNFHPIFPNDDTFLSMDIHGGVYRRGVHNGSLVWHSPPPKEYQTSFTDGGLITGPDNTVYACANLQTGGPFTHGSLRAYRLSDGKTVFDKWLPYPCVSWPAADDKMVVVPIGALPESSSRAHTMEKPAWMPQLVEKFVRLAIWYVDLALGDSQNQLWGDGGTTRPLAVHAFDAKTGKELWDFHDIPIWRRHTSRSDAEWTYKRMPKYPFRPVCGPASWSSPTIDGAGTVYAGAMNGIFYAVGDKNGNGRIEKDEVQTLEMGHASLHPGTSWAPGMFAYASCEGFYVFKF